MAKLVTKFKYLKPGGRNRIGRYAKYIATREGVERIDESHKFLSVTGSQKEMIAKILHDFPDSKDMLEYEDYLAQQTIGAASEFISRALEDNAAEVMTGKTYADYIATRLRAERFGSHGLFTDDGVPVQLSKVSEELNLHGGNVWTVIISLRREDAERLGFNMGTRWRDMLRTQTEALADNLKIPMENLRWFAAFHNESHHPHAHLIVYSQVENEGYLTQKGVANLRSSFARDIFAQDLLSVYEKKSAHRTALRRSGGEILTEIVAAINAGEYENPKMEELLKQLSDRLSKTTGKKIYGYLKADVKDLVDAVLRELAADERIAKLYDLWYFQQEESQRIYSQALPKRIPLENNKEFASIKNAIIQEALAISEEIPTFEDEAFADADIPIPTAPAADPESVESDDRHETYVKWTKEYRFARLLRYGSSQSEPDYERAFFFMRAEAEKGNVFALHDVGKMFLDGIGCDPDERIAQEWFARAYQGFLKAEASAERSDYIQYRIGKMHAFGCGVEQSYEQSASWYQKAVAAGNPFASYALGSQYYRGQGVGQDYEKAFELYRMAALDTSRPNAYAMYELCKMCRDGVGTKRDTAAATEWFQDAYTVFLAMEKKMPDDKLQYRIGQMAMSGMGTPADFDAARFYFTKSAALKNVYALYGLGKLFLNKQYSDRDSKKAVGYFVEAAQLGHEFAQYQLGKMYLSGEEVPKDAEYALRWLEAAEMQGSQHAQYLLGKIYLTGNDVPQEIEKAVRLLTKSVAQGNAYAAYALGKAYLDGDILPRDTLKAVQLLAMSAHKGFNAAEYVLGKTLCKGEMTPKEMGRGIAYLTSAADKGNQYAEYLLGKLYLTGEDIPQDIQRAVYWLTQSAEQGNMVAQYALAKLYLYGKDVERDVAKAIALLTASAGQGNSYAAYLLRSIRSNRNFGIALGSIRLLTRLGRIIQSKLPDERRGSAEIVESRERSKISEKKAAHGIRQE